jgi:cullin 1
MNLEPPEIIWTKIETITQNFLNHFTQNSLITRLQLCITQDDYAYVISAVNIFTSSPKVKIVSDFINQNKLKVLSQNNYFIYHHLKLLLESHFDIIYKISLDCPNDNLLEFYKKECDKLEIISKMLTSMFNYLDRYWAKERISVQKKNIKNTSSVFTIEIDNLSSDDIYDIYSLSYITWCKHFFLKIEQRILFVILKMIRTERAGEQIDTSLVKFVIGSYIKFALNPYDKLETNLSLYNKYFEKPFLQETMDFFNRESLMVLQDNNTSEYARYVQKRLHEEQMRLAEYLHHSSENKLLSICHQTLIKTHQEQIQLEFINLLIGPEAGDLLNEQISNLERIYELLSKIPESLDNLYICFNEHVLKEGMLVMDQTYENTLGKSEQSTSEDPNQTNEPSDVSNIAEYIQNLTKFYEKYQTILNHSLESDTNFTVNFDKAMKQVMNNNVFCIQDNNVGINISSSAKSAEYLAKYSDILLKKNTQTHLIRMRPHPLLSASSAFNQSTKTEKFLEQNKIISKSHKLNDDPNDVTNEFTKENEIKRLMYIFKYLDDKDVFQIYYSKLFARRLINDNSSSEDLEELMINQLKEACGSEYTKKLHKMFNDIQISRDLTQEFKEKIIERPNSTKQKISFELSFSILCYGSWPLSSPTKSFNLVPELEKVINIFQQFYINKHSGRKLIWLSNISKGELKTNYLSSPYVFQVSTQQISILMAYNNSDSYRFEELIACTELSEDLLKQNMDVLVKSKIIISTKPNQYDLNYNIKLKKLKININLPMKADTRREQEDTQKYVEEDRKILIQACLVRIMKTKKQTNYNTLVAECIQQLRNRFIPAIHDIKKSIDMLIEKDYIERTKDKDIFNYIA